MKRAFILGSLLTLSLFTFTTNDPATIHLSTVEFPEVSSYVPVPPLLPPVGEVGPATVVTAPHTPTVHGKVNSPELVSAPNWPVEAPAVLPPVLTGVVRCENLSDGTDAQSANGKPGWYPVILDASSVVDWTNFRNCEPYHG